MNRDLPSPGFDEELRGLMRAQVEVITPQGDPMTEIALRGSLRQRRRRNLTITGAALAVAAVVVAVVAGPHLLEGSPDRGQPVRPGPASPAAVDLRQPAQGEVAATIKLPAADSTDGFLAVASVAYDHVFVHIQRKPSAIVVKVDPDTDKVVASVTFPKDTALYDGAVPVSAAGALWWPGYDALFRLDPDDLRITATIPVPGGTVAIAPTAGAAASDGTRVWVISAQDQVARIDTSTNRLTHSTAFSWPGPGRAELLAYAAGSLWVSAGTSVVQLNADDLSVISRTTLPERPSSMLAVGDKIWLSLPRLDQLVRVTAKGIDGQPLQLPPGNPDGYDPQLASSSDGKTVWSMTDDNHLVAVDVASGQVVDHIQINESQPQSMVAVRGQTVWVPAGQHPELRRFDWQPRRR
jgi:outer membrane protein assembly factor BamB